MRFPLLVDPLPDAEGAAQHAPVVVVFGLFFAAAAVASKSHVFPRPSAGHVVHSDAMLFQVCGSGFHAQDRDAQMLKLCSALAGTKRDIGQRGTVQPAAAFVHAADETPTCRNLDQEGVS